jgi:endonuclease/exonuclease/phosphatase family metal-dependent hydrolase
VVVSVCAVSAGAQTANLALNRPAVASSTGGSTYAASMAVDGQSSTRWSSDFTDNEWWYVDLGATYTISKIVISWEAAYARTYDLQVSQDAVAWTTFFSGTNTFPTNGAGTSTVTVPATGRYIRVVGKTRAIVWGGQWGYSFWEFQAFGTLLGPPPPVTGLSPADGATLVPLTQPLTWTSSSGATSYDVAFGSTNPPPVVSTSQAAASYSPGPLAFATTYYWQVTSKNASGSTTSSVARFTTIPQPVLTTIAVTPQNSSVAAAANLMFTANGFDQQSQPFATTFVWASSAPSVGTIDPASGLFTAVTPGTTTITATSATVTGSATVSVIPRHNTSMTRLRIVSWNVAQGYTPLRVYAHQAQIDLIASISPDIVVLSEMSLADNDMVSAFLAGMTSRTGKPWAGHFSPGIPGAAPTNSIGDMIMTWLPVDSQTTLPYCVIPGDQSSPNDTSCVTFEHLGVTVNNVAVDIASAHLNWFSSANRAAQLQQLLAWMAPYGPVPMLVGDFNAEPGDPSLWSPLRVSYQDVWATVVGSTGDLGITMDHRTVTNAPGRIDYHFIPLNATHVGIQQFSVVKTALSDHHLLFGDYVIVP